MPKCRFIRKYWVTVILLSLIFSYLPWNAYSPSVICAEEFLLNGIVCRKVPDMVIQGHDPDGILWATRGLWAYSLSQDGNCFQRQYRIPTGLSPYWLFNFTLTRKLTGRVQNVELMPLAGGDAIVVSSGWIWHRSSEPGAFKKVKRLRYYGYGTGRGVLAAGIFGYSDGRVMIGEYPTNSQRENVRVYISDRNDYQNWEIAHEFPAGQVRHVHAIQKDPYTGLIWVFTGDRDDESMAMTIDPSGEKRVIGTGAQRWRVVQAIFTENAVYWGADTGGPDGGIWKWKRDTEELTRLNTIHGTVYYANHLSDNTFVFAHAARKVDELTDNKARLWLLADNNEPWPVLLGTKKKPVFGKTRTAIPRFSRTHGDENLFVTLINIAGLHGDMLIIHPSNLKKLYSEQTVQETEEMLVIPDNPTN